MSGGPSGIGIAIQTRNGAVLLSMTGYGEGRDQSSGLDVAVELRSINNRHLKFTIRVPEGCGSWEPALEEELRGKLRRGTVYLTVRVQRQANPDDCRINTTILQSYRDQLELLGDRPRLVELLSLPGVVELATAGAFDQDVAWPLVKKAVAAALEQLQQMRSREGESMRRELADMLAALNQQLQAVRERAPRVVAAYEQRILERVRQALVEHAGAVTPQDVLREVSLFADRVDVGEEMVRLASHFDQAAQILDESEGAGRRLDFLIQEMFREVNTIGSKANDAEIARHVVEMKSTLERMREIVQNVE